MAFTRKEKEALVDQYTKWVDNSQAFFVISFNKMNMTAIDEARKELREVDAEMHVVKNRLFKLVMNEKGMDYDEGFWQENNMIGFAFSDPPTVAKVINNIAKSSVFDIRLGYLENKQLSADQVKALADLPTLPVMQATLLGTIMASASKLVRTLAEPSRSLAAVVKAYSEDGEAAKATA